MSCPTCGVEFPPFADIEMPYGVLSAATRRTTGHLLKECPNMGIISTKGKGKKVLPCDWCETKWSELGREHARIQREFDAKWWANHAH